MIVFVPALANAAKSHGPAFECGPENSVTEAAICNSQRLSKMDRKLNQVFINALKELKKNQNSLRKNQIEWLEKRNQCKEESECIRRKYAQRIRQLKSMIANEESGDNPNVCNKVRHIAEKQELKKFGVPSGGGPDYVSYKGIDLDRDGEDDEVKVESGSFESALTVQLSSGGRFVHTNGIMRVIRFMNEVLGVGVYTDPETTENYPAYYDLFRLHSSGVDKLCEFEITSKEVSRR